VEDGFETVGQELEAVRLRSALGEAMRLASEVNKYLDQIAPWQMVKTDKAAAARSIFTALKAIDSLKVMLSPFLPFTSEQLHTFLGYEGQLFGEQFLETEKDSLGEHQALRYNPEKATGRWEPSQLQPGQALNNPRPLFRKLDVAIVEEERGKLGGH
jgi:methionyl-tRNA synthetase